jgi:uncharacterized protein (DUF1800 family)
MARANERTVFMGTRGAIILMTTLAMSAAPAAGATPDRLAIVNRLSWGVTDASAAAPRDIDRWIDEQLQPRGDAAIPAAAQAQIDGMRIVREPMAQLVVEMDAQNKAYGAITDPAQKQLAVTAYQQAMRGLADEAATRSLLRDLYSPAQLREQMTWFWFNHFNVQANKRDIRAMVGDYEDQAIRGHALGRFRDLLEATLRHPAMLRYLDNDQNAANHINENYAREIMELHTMGVGSGYSQKDVQELARILTGVGVDLKPDPPTLKPALQPLYIRDGLFEFNPARHDFGDKVFLGHTIKGSGYAEVEQALDLIAASPATAHHVSAQLAAYFMGDAVPPALVDRMAATFRSSKGDIPRVLRTLFNSREFKASLGTGFKDPVHYAVSAVRLAYGDRIVLNTAPITNWLNRMGEGLYAHETPDGYPMTSAAWTGPGQMAVRFEIARQIGYNGAPLFTPPKPPAPPTPPPAPEMAATPTMAMTPEMSAMSGPPAPAAPVAPPPVPPVVPQIQNAAWFAQLRPSIRPATRDVLAAATSPREWNALFLSSPDFMRR